MNILISGASTGIGYATSLHLANKGHAVWAGVRSEKSFAELKALKVKGLNPVYLDVTQENSIRECFAVLQKNQISLDGLVNNAGIAVGGPVEGVSMEDWRHQFEVNFFGQIRVTQLSLPMLRENHGRIVMMSSIAGRVASPFLGPYSASKFAIEAVTDSLRREMRRFGVQVSVVEPGPIDTPIWEKSLGSGAAKAKAFSPEILKTYGSMMEKFNSRVDLAAKSASPVSVVVHAVEHALTSRSPRTRYPVGRGVAFSTKLASVLPDTWMDRVLR